MINDRDFIFDNFEEEEKDNAVFNNVNVSVESVVEATEETTEENIFPSVTLDELTDEQQDKLFSVLGNGLNKIFHDLCNFDDDYLPF